LTQQSKTGTSNTYYNLVSIMYHALNGAQTYDTYIRDAQQSGDNELAQFFREVQQEDNRRSERAKQLLVQRAGQMSQGGSMR
jgi:alpha-D-ribose 1-methylphosphonate 5-triphosphate diphosphatase PhnM